MNGMDIEYFNKILREDFGDSFKPFKMTKGTVIWTNQKK